MGVLYLSLNYVHVSVFVCGHVPMCAGDYGDQRYQIPLDTELKEGCELPGCWELWEQCESHFPSPLFECLMAILNGYCLEDYCGQAAMAESACQACWGCLGSAASPLSCGCLCTRGQGFPRWGGDAMNKKSQHSEWQWVRNHTQAEPLLRKHSA